MVTKFYVDKFQAKGLIILVVIIFCAEIFVTVARGVLLEELVRITSYSEGLEIVSSAVGADSMTSGLAWFESLIVGASGTETVSL